MIYLFNTRMPKQTQRQRVISKLLKDGFITRNECLRVYISRLSAIIQVLEVEGWEFEAKDKEGDYIYKITKCPLTKQVYKLPNGEEVTTYKQ